VVINNCNLSFQKTFRDKKILITGNTGFKGSWLTLWLVKLGAQVTGFSDNSATNPSMYQLLNINRKIKQVYGDIADRDSVLSVVKDVKPDFIFHLAAQSIVSKSYSNPLETIRTNSLGTANLLDVIIETNFKGVAVMITSDKCYENDERDYGYIESDRLGGRDPYSASKAAAEIFLSSYIKSFFIDSKTPRIGIARAGNVIGGGDWNSNRIVVDCARAWMSGEEVNIRNPEATRPWQHVLEPISGYLNLAQALSLDPNLHGEAFNFGPEESNVYTVREIANKFIDYWNFKETDRFIKFTKNTTMHEAKLLKLNCEKARLKLNWAPKLNIDECLKLVADWYLEFKKNSNNLENLTLSQIEFYEQKLS